MRSRFLLAFSLILLCAAALCALALAPAEVGLAFFSPPPAQTSQGTIDATQDNAAVAHTKALLATTVTLISTSTLDDVVAALSQEGPGVKINDISYSVSGSSLTLTGTAQAPSDVNTFRQNLQTDLRFSDVSVPVSALLGSQSGGFTITMKLTE
jgi:ABC-type glycerol-3-phosphate transport system substrate-binding protein